MRKSQRLYLFFSILTTGSDGLYQANGWTASYTYGPNH
jgi:hypothetical protein